MRDPLQRLISQWESDHSLLEANQLSRRMAVLDQFDAHFPDADSQSTGSQFMNQELRRRARAMRDRLEAANSELYQAIRLEIQRGHCPDMFLRVLQQASSNTAVFPPPRGIGYDYLDELLSGVLQLDESTGEPVCTGPENVLYQPTPARHIFALIRAAALSKCDVLIDLGSGLGHVPLLVSICTGAHCLGIEQEPGYVASARDCARRLNLNRVSFFEEDARSANLSQGTVFYLYTPFIGSILRDVMISLRQQAMIRPIKVCTFGPCTAMFAREPWLEAMMRPERDQITVFVSRS